MTHYICTVFELYTYITNNDIMILKFNLYTIKYKYAAGDTYVVDISCCTDYKKYEKIWNLLYNSRRLL